MEVDGVVDFLLVLRHPHDGAVKQRGVSGLTDLRRQKKKTQNELLQEF